MASNQINIRVDGKDNTSKAFSSVSSSISKLNTTANKTGSTIGTAIGKGATTASTSIGKLGTTASSTFQKMASGASAAGKSLSNAFDGIGGAIAGIAGGYGVMQMAQQAWIGSTTAEFNKAFLATKVGNEAAGQYVKTIQGIVAQVPGDDTFMNNLLTGALAKQTNLSTQELTTLGNITADYLATSAGMGKSSIETQSDLNEYIKTGNTSQLERDSILKGQMSTLEGQGTVSERILALQKALRDEGYLGISQLDTTAQKWEKVNGLVQLTLTAMGDRLLPTIGSILNFVLDLDEATNGWSTTIGAIVAGFGLMLPAIGMAWAPLSAMINGTAKLAGYIGSAVTKLWEYVVAAKAADKADDGIGTGGTKGGTKGGKTGGLGISNILTFLGGAALTTGAYALGAAIAGTVTLAAGNTFADSGSWYWGLKTDGSFGWSQSKPISGPGNNKVANDFGESLKFMGEDWNYFCGRVNLKGQQLSAWLGGVWNNIKASFGGATAYIKGMWGNTVAWIRNGANQAASGAVAAWNWIRNSAQSVFSSVYGAAASAYSYIRGGAYGVISIGTGAISAAWNAVAGLYNYVRNGVTGVIKLVTGSGPAGPSQARGPSGPFDNLKYSYINYAGHKDGYPKMVGNTLYGNCVDMSMGMMAMNGGTGSIVSGTWNGGPHVWYKDPSGQAWDGARKALNGTFTPPPRGPSGPNGSGIVIDMRGATVYDGPSFKKAIEHELNSMAVRVM